MIVKSETELRLEADIQAINAEIDVVDGHKNILMEKKRELAERRNVLCRELEHHIRSTAPQRNVERQRLQAMAAEAKAS